MRDRLNNLHQLQIDSEGFSTVELSTLSENGAASDPDEDLDCVLKEAQIIRLEIQQIQDDISTLKEVNYQTLNQTSHPVATTRGSNEIGADIKRRAEAVLQQLHTMNDLSRALETKLGTSDPTARIARTQYHCLSNALREVMFRYNDTEMNHREACKRNVKRQMEVLGKEVSEEELEEMMGGEELCLFSIHVMGKTACSALLQIESRHQELLELEERIKGIQELFLDVAVLVEEQGTATESIEKNVQNTEMFVQGATVQLEKATASDKNNPCKKLFCGCFPCYHN